MSLPERFTAAAYHRPARAAIALGPLPVIRSECEIHDLQPQ